MELIQDPRYECGLLSIGGAEDMPDWWSPSTSVKTAAPCPKGMP